jgi:hypothetical protein
MIQIVCHRGANEYTPENTYASSQLCMDWGMDMIEIDVSCSHDGVLYLFHGPQLEKTTNGQGLIMERGSAEIDQLDARSRFSPDFAGERIPRLADGHRRNRGACLASDRATGDLRHCGLRCIWRRRDASAQAIQRAIATDRAVDSGRKLIQAASSGLLDAGFESLRHCRQF